MNLSQSTVSRRIRVLERRLGIELFERDPSGAYLTPAGAKFVEDAERGMTALLRAVDNARNLHKGATGVLRIGLMTSLSGGFLSDSLKAFHTKYPEVEFEINEITSESGLGRVDKRDSPGAVIVIQAGICNGDQRGTKPDVERRVGVL